MLKSWHVSIVLRCGGELLKLHYLVQCGACLELLCELCATDGYIQGDSSCVGGMRWAADELLAVREGYILYICCE